MAKALKNTISHRGRSLALLRAHFEAEHAAGRLIPAPPAEAAPASEGPLSGTKRARVEGEEAKQLH